MAALLQTLAQPAMPSAAQIVTLDLETVGVDPATVPLDEVIAVSDEHREDYRAHRRRLRQVVAELGVLPEPD